MTFDFRPLDLSMIIKVCGMREQQNIADLQTLNIDMIGFIFYEKSPRYVENAPMTKNLSRVGVFVNENAANITAIAIANKLTHLQLHGGESVETCLQLKQKGYKIIKAISIKESTDFLKAKEYEGAADYLLFDTKCEGYGGSGLSFDWSMLNNYKGNTPFLLSGGIKTEMAQSIKAISHPQFVGIDLNSGFEISPAYKDIKELTTFLNTIR